MLSISWGEKLEKGATSHVYFAHLDNQPVAIKIISAAGEKLFKKELEIYKKLSARPHPYIIRMLEAREHEYVSESHYNLLILEYMPGGDLVSYFTRLNRYLTENERRTIFYETVQAVNHLHDLDIMHGDIKRENILVNGDGHIKLCDFGTAKEILPEQPYIEHKNNSGLKCDGTPEYIAPETWTLFRYSKNSDMYALGILLWAICSVSNIYKKRSTGGLCTPDEIKRHVVLGRRPKALSTTKISSIEQSLMHRLWAQNPEERPSAKAVLSDPLFTMQCDSPELNQPITALP